MTEGRGAYFYQIYDLKISTNQNIFPAKVFAGLCILMIFYEDVQMPQTFSSLYLDTTGPAMSVNYRMCGNAPDTFL